MFPTFPEHILQQVLENADSVEDAAVILLEMEPPAELDILPDENAPPREESPPRYDDFMDIEEDEGGQDEIWIGPQKEDEKAKAPELDDCLAQIVSVFPDVCTDHVKKEYGENVDTQGHNIVNSILNSLIEMGPKRPRAEVGNPRKRKRSADGFEQSKFEAADRELPDGYKPIA